MADIYEFVMDNITDPESIEQAVDLLLDHPQEFINAIGGWDKLVLATGGAYYNTALGFEAVWD